MIGTPDFTQGNRDSCYFAIGKYSSHLSLDISASHANSRAYLMQLMVDSIADDTSGNYMMGFYPRINITTAHQTNISFSALSPSITAVKNFKAIRCMKSEVDISDAGVTTTLSGVYSVSGYLKLGSSGTLTGGGTSVATGIFDFEGGTGLTLAGGCRTFAIFGNVYTASTATGIALLRVDGTGIVTSGLCIESPGGSTMTNAIQLTDVGGITNLLKIPASGPCSASTGTTPAGDGYIIKIDIGGGTYYLRAASTWT